MWSPQATSYGSALKAQKKASSSALSPAAESSAGPAAAGSNLLVTNVDQVLIVASAAEPRLKPNLIDRYLITAEKAGIEPILCINKNRPHRARRFAGRLWEFTAS